MRIRHNLKGTKGFVTAYNRAVRFNYMISKVAKRRTRILIHWEKHGIESTIDAFGVKRRTLFNWKRLFESGGRKPEALNPQSRTPKQQRTRDWNPRIIAEIKRLRDQYPNLGAAKIYPLLLDYTDSRGLSQCPKKATIERLIKDLGGLRTTPQKITNTGRTKPVSRIKIQRKPKGFTALYPGHCIALDTIEKQQNGRRLYILTAIDVYTRTTFAIGTKSHASKTAAHFFSIVQKLFPYPVHTVLSDNGSEFKKHLSQVLTERGITHYHTYPRTPKQNAHCERFNGTVQTEFVDHQLSCLFADLTAFNQKLHEYLRFYNTKRVHYAFKNQLTPVEKLLQSTYYTQRLSRECNWGWGYTNSCKYFILAYNCAHLSSL